MALKNYGVLAGRAVGKRREGGRDTPHFQIHLVDEDAVSYRIAVNVLSKEEPSQLLYLADEDFAHPITDDLPEAGSGWTPLDRGLDFVRGGLVDRTSMIALPPEVPGPGNDLADRLETHIDKAVADPAVAVYVFGERWGPEGKADKIFGFAPGNGVHDVHMNQGNSPAFRRDDGVWQDGGILLRFPGDEPHWVAIFLAFQSQSWHTDDLTGHTRSDVASLAEAVPAQAAPAPRTVPAG
ncbi:YukJ family protein [Actinocorallia longicatena]|uniref:YukJ family protein n=1 Tax=Actinocorallia longicatena TaxID=111803 RepID=A0ABP6PW16_9ACTN